MVHSTLPDCCNQMLILRSSQATADKSKRKIAGKRHRNSGLPNLCLSWKTVMPGFYIVSSDVRIASFVSHVHVLYFLERKNTCSSVRQKLACYWKPQNLSFVSCMYVSAKMDRLPHLILAWKLVGKFDTNKS